MANRAPLPTLRTMRYVAASMATLACVLGPHVAQACPACQGVVDAEVLARFWPNLGLVAAPFAVFGLVAALAYRVR